jgi:ABC-type transporter lipoprotein component MlaA
MSIGKWAVEGIETRSAAGFDGLLRQSSDPYIMVREAYFSVMTLSPTAVS